MNIDSNKWINTLPKKGESMNIDSNKWTDTLPKKKENYSKKKYLVTIFIFLLSLISIPIIKNETRSLQKEINYLRASIESLKMNLHQETLDHEVITSPENISQMAKEYLDLNLVSYNRSQIKKFDKDNINFQVLKKDKGSNNYSKKAKVITDEIKSKVAKHVVRKRENLKQIQRLYSEPENIPAEIKSQMSKKIKTTATGLKNLYEVIFFNNLINVLIISKCLFS